MSRDDWGPSDADYDMMGMQEAAANAAAGVCSICDDILDPTLPKWAQEVSAMKAAAWRGGEPGRSLTPAEYADDVGPVCADMPYHVRCIEDQCR